MAKKKNQHLVPVCYLKEFISDVPVKQETNPNYQAGVYVNDKYLCGKWRQRSIRHNVFTKSYYYNLKNDNTKNPEIENFLSKVENYYPKAITQLKARIVSKNILSYLSYFVCLQHMRVEPFMDMMQSTFDKLAMWTDEFNGNNDASTEVEDLSKKMLKYYEHSESWFSQTATILVNSTNFPFVTSDNPVFKRMVNTDDLTALIGRKNVDISALRSKEKALFILPLTPNLAFVSCDLLSKEIRHSCFVLDDLHCIFMINYYGIRNATVYVYSSVVEPIKSEKELSKHLLQLKDEHSKSGYIVKLITESNRFTFPIEQYSSTNESIDFTTQNKEFLNSISSGEEISLIEVINNGLSVRGMRHCVLTIKENKPGSISIKSKIRLGI